MINPFNFDLKLTNAQIQPTNQYQKPQIIVKTVKETINMYDDEKIQTLSDLLNSERKLLFECQNQLSQYKSKLRAKQCEVEHYQNLLKQKQIELNVSKMANKAKVLSVGEDVTTEAQMLCLETICQVQEMMKEFESIK